MVVRGAGVRGASNWIVPRSVLVLLMVTLLMMDSVPVWSAESGAVGSPLRIDPPGFTMTDLPFPTSGMMLPLPASTAPFPTTTLPVGLAPVPRVAPVPLRASVPPWMSVLPW